jgi:hypothetical protein
MGGTSDIDRDVGPQTGFWEITPDKSASRPECLRLRLVNSRRRQWVSPDPPLPQMNGAGASSTVCVIRPCELGTSAEAGFR